uniref:Uncharacterized protein n=1 Tax=Opuntia streptacantha TaxID=393608 RepID=A0A7C9E705_OPUST
MDRYRTNEHDPCSKSLKASTFHSNTPKKDPGKNGSAREFMKTSDLPRYNIEHILAIHCNAHQEVSYYQSISKIRWHPPRIASGDENSIRLAGVGISIQTIARNDGRVFVFGGGGL